MAQQSTDNAFTRVLVWYSPGYFKRAVVLLSECSMTGKSFEANERILYLRMGSDALSGCYKSDSRGSISNVDQGTLSKRNCMDDD